jgi:translation initiation factor IF-1
VAKKRGGRRKKFDGPNKERRDHILLDGVVTQVYAGSQFEVELDNGASVKAQLGGKMRKFRIRVLLGDRVTVALSPYDLTHGMIVFRHKAPRRDAFGG